MRYFIFSIILLIGAAGLYAQDNANLSSNDVSTETVNEDLALANNYYENGEWELAVEFYERAKRGGGFTSNDLNHHAIALIELDRYEGAQRLLERLTEIVPDDKVAWFNLGIVYYHFDRYPSALSCFQNAAEIESDWARTWYCVAICELQMGRLSAAWETLDNVIALDEELGQELLEMIVAEEAYRNDPMGEE